MLPHHVFPSHDPGQRHYFAPAFYKRDLPLLDHPLSEWMVEMLPSGGLNGVSPHLTPIEWMKTLGFDKEKHMVREHDLQIMRHVVEHTFLHWRRIAYQKKLSEIITLIRKPTNTRDHLSLYIQGQHYYFMPKSWLQKVWSESGMIYGSLSSDKYHIGFTGPDNTAFQVSYQQILGSRMLATVTDKEEALAQIVEDGKELGYE